MAADSDTPTCPISSLPSEILYKILNELEDVDAINSALVCMKWNAINPAKLSIDELRVVLNGSCNSDSKLNKLEFLSNICTCKDHASEQCTMLRHLLSLNGFQNVKKIYIEDENAFPRNYNEKSPIATIVHHLNKDVEVMQLSNIDISLFDIMTFYKLAEFRNISTLVLVDCVFPKGYANNHSFVKALTPILPNIEHIELTGTPFVNDQFGLALAKYGLSLANVNLQRCNNITAITIASFCTHAGSRERIKPVTFDLHSTSFDANTLDRYLHRLEQMNEKPWKLNLFDMRQTTGRLKITISSTDENGYVILY